REVQGSYLISVPYEEFQLERLVDSSIGGLCDISSALNRSAIARPAIISADAIAGVHTDDSYSDADADADTGAGTGSGRSAKAVVRFLRSGAGSGSECRIES